jgi:hypothetical protein
MVAQQGLATSIENHFFDGGYRIVQTLVFFQRTVYVQKRGKAGWPRRRFGRLGPLGQEAAAGQ